MVFGDALSAEPIMRLDDVIELDLPASHDGVQQDDVHIAAPALGAQTRPLSFDMSDLSLDRAARPRSTHRPRPRCRCRRRP